LSKISRREFVALAFSLGASVAWGRQRPRASASRWVERRDLFTEGVASGDPASESVLLWTRASFGAGASVRLTVEVAEDPAFERVVATAPALARREADYTCRVLVGRLKPATTYWYRFADAAGRGSRVGRTMTAPDGEDTRPFCFAFVSCQNICEGVQHAYRRMIYEDERAPEGKQLSFVLHLGDFIYEVVDYPEERPGGRRYDRRLRDLIRFPDGERISRTSHVAASLEDYRTLYRTYLRDPDLQDARARWPFVPIWDNHEFSWMGWQAFQRFGGESRPAQVRKVQANQAWFEYQPARVRQGTTAIDRYIPPSVRNRPVQRFDENGLGIEANNRAAIRSLTAYRTLRWGRHLELFITDQHSYRSEEGTSAAGSKTFTTPDYPELFPQEVLEILDAGRTYNQGQPPATVRFGATAIRNHRAAAPPQTILGAEQKAWFLRVLRRSNATWKVWGCSQGTLDWRADPQNVPREMAPSWPGPGYAGFGGGDFSTAYVERAEIYDAIRTAGVTGFVTVSGDRHSFWAGYSAKQLPPRPFEPIGVAFTTGSISAPGLVEALEHVLPKDHRLRTLYLLDRKDGPPEPTVNMLMRHGVRSCVEYSRSHDVAAARRASNPELAPHLTFIDMGGHGYATIRLDAEMVTCEFVCIPRPIERSESADGGPVRYRIVHKSRLWTRGQRPVMEQVIVDGDPGLGL
jgi:alkaline phosphatase D